MINSTSDWITTPMEVLNTTPEGIVFSKGDITTILTNIGSPVRLPSVMVYSCDLRTDRHAYAPLFYVAGQYQRFREDVLPQQRVCHDRVSHPSRARLTTCPISENLCPPQHSHVHPVRRRQRRDRRGPVLQGRRPRRPRPGQRARGLRALRARARDGHAVQGLAGHRDRQWRTQADVRVCRTDCARGCAAHGRREPGTIVPSGSLVLSRLRLHASYDPRRPVPDILTMSNFSLSVFLPGFVFALLCSFSGRCTQRPSSQPQPLRRRACSQSSLILGPASHSSVHGLPLSLLLLLGLARVVRPTVHASDSLYFSCSLT